MTPKPVDRPAGIHHAGKVSLTVKAARKPEPDEVVWPRGFVVGGTTATGGHVGGTTITHAAVFDPTPRSWFDRLFTLPWRPFQKYREPVVIDLQEGSDG